MKHQLNRFCFVIMYIFLCIRTGTHFVLWQKLMPESSQRILQGIGKILSEVGMAYREITLLLASVYFLSFSVTGEITKVRFPYNPETDKFPRVNLEASFSSLSSFTLCQWAKPNFDHGEMALFNYGVPGQDREILITLEDGIVRFYVGGKLLINGKCDGRFTIQWISGAWHHICVTWTPSQTSIKFFVNGKFCNSASEPLDHKIPGNGVMVLGQALKGLDTDFHRNYSWSGDIAGVQMWDEVLRYTQIVREGRCERELEGNVVSWMKTPMVASGGIIFLHTNVCNVLDKKSD